MQWFCIFMNDERVAATKATGQSPLARAHPGYADLWRPDAAPGRISPFAVGHGLGTADDPILPGMHCITALIAGGSVTAALAIATGEVDRAANFCGELHHAMPDAVSGFCVTNDAASAVAAMLDAGAGKVAYVDLDAHPGDGVQSAFYDDPRVLRCPPQEHR